MAETQTTTVSIEDVISLVVPPAAGGYLKLVCDESERYFQPLGGAGAGSQASAMASTTSSPRIRATRTSARARGHDPSRRRQ